MNIMYINKEQVRRMQDKEGLILQGCGGSTQDWLTGINDMFTQREILQNDTKFKNIYVFEHNGLTNILFPFEKDIELNIGKLAMWRIGTYHQFGGTWLSDYVPNCLGGFLNEEVIQKPDCPLIGQNGNIFNLMGIASRTLREAGMSDQAKEMCQRIRESDSYNAALNIIGDYVNITSVDECEDEDFQMEL